MSGNKGVSRTLIVWLLFASILVIGIIAVVSVIFISNEKNKSEEFFDSGSVVMTYAENSDIFFINDMKPVADETGRVNSTDGEYYDFTIKVNLGDSNTVDYEIALEMVEDFTTALPNTVKIYLEQQDSGTYIPVAEPETFDNLESNSDYGASKEAKIIARVSCDDTVSHNYRLRMWLADGTVITPEVLQSFGIEIKVYGDAK